MFACATHAKTTSLMCETMAASQSPVTFGPGSQYTGRDASYSTWSIVIDTDDTGKITKVTLDDTDKEFEVKGDLLKLRGKLLTSLEVNVRTGRARTTITGFDTKEQGVCKVVSKSEGNLLN